MQMYGKEPLGQRIILRYDETASLIVSMWVQYFG